MLQKAGFIDHQNRLGISKSVQGVVPNNIAQGIGIPRGASQNGLLPPRTRISSRFRSHPARLAPFLAQQPVEKPFGRYRNACCVNSGRMRAFAARSDEAQSYSVSSTDKLAIHKPPSIMKAHGFRQKRRMQL